MPVIKLDTKKMCTDFSIFFTIKSIHLDKVVSQQSFPYFGQFEIEGNLFKCCQSTRDFAKLKKIDITKI